MSKLLRSPEFTLVTPAIILAGITALAYSQLGFLGLALVGLFLLFMSVQSELQKNGIQKPFAAESLSRMERLPQEAEGQGMARFWKLAAIIGAVLAVIGTAGFIFIQLPS